VPTGFYCRGSRVAARVRRRSSHILAPTPDDLLIASIASELAWTARRFLLAYGLPEDVSVSATWRTPEDPRPLADINVTATVSGRAEAVSPVAGRCLRELPRSVIPCRADRTHLAGRSEPMKPMSATRLFGTPCLEAHSRTAPSRSARTGRLIPFRRSS